LHERERKEGESGEAADEGGTPHGDADLGQKEYREHAEENGDDVPPGDGFSVVSPGHGLGLNLVLVLLPGLDHGHLGPSDLPGEGFVLGAGALGGQQLLLGRWCLSKWW
jgi:hypothetical protein